jgi:hypothetical protein
MNSLKNQKNFRYQPGNMKITSDLTNLTTAILILTVQMFFEWTSFSQGKKLSFWEKIFSHVVQRSKENNISNVEFGHLIQKSGRSFAEYSKSSTSND